MVMGESLILIFSTLRPTGVTTLLHLPIIDHFARKSNHRKTEPRLDSVTNLVGRHQRTIVMSCLAYGHTPAKSSIKICFVEKKENQMLGWCIKRDDFMLCTSEGYYRILTASSRAPAFHSSTPD